MDKRIIFAAWSGVIAIIAIIALFFISEKSSIGQLAINVANLGLLVVFYGFYRIASREKATLLKVMTVLSLIITIVLVIGNLIDLLGIKEKIITATAGWFGLAVVISIAEGLFVLLFGAGLLKLQKRFGKLATLSAWSDMIGGSAFILGVLSISILRLPDMTVGIMMVASLVMLIGMLLKVALLFKAAKAYR